MNPFKSDTAPETESELLHEFKHEWRLMRSKRDRAFGRKPLRKLDRRIIGRMDGKHASGVPVLASNGKARRRLVKHLLTIFRQVLDDGLHSEFLHVTIISRKWDTSDERTKLDLDAIHAQASAILNAMSPHWAGAIELQVWANRRHRKGGKIICPHVHATVFGTNIVAQARAVADQANQRLTTAVPGVKAVHVQLIAPAFIDLARVVRYPLKAVSRNKTYYVHPTSKRVNFHESEKGDRFIRYFRIFQILSLIELPQLLIAGGDGRRIQDRALAELLRGYSKRRQQIGGGMAAIEAFWEEFIPRIGWARFRLPCIRNRTLPTTHG